MKSVHLMIALMGVFVLSPVLAVEAPVPVHDTLVNAAFTLPLATGWRQTSKDYVGYHGFEQLKEGGVRVAKEMCGHATLSQDIRLKNLRTVFSTKARFATANNQPNLYAYAAVGLAYLDKDDAVLGETRYYSAAGAVPFKSSATLHAVPVSESGWTPVTVNIGDELATNLKGVPAGKVAKLRISLESFGSGMQSC